MRQVVTAADYSRLKRMTMKQVNDWVVSLYASAFQDGHDDIMADAVVLDSDVVLAILLSVKGIGRKRAEEALQKIYEGGRAYGASGTNGGGL